jgi:hypothetical protein
MLKAELDLPIAGENFPRLCPAAEPPNLHLAKKPPQYWVFLRRLKQVCSDRSAEKENE